MRRIISVICLLLVGCSKREAHIDPPLYTYATDQQTKLSAIAKTSAVGGHLYSIDASKHSMEPLLLDKDLVVVVKVPYSSLLKGEVITYWADWKTDHPVTHRLAQHDSGGWIMSGDNNPRSEPQWRVTEKNYVGKVVGIYRTKP